MTSAPTAESPATATPPTAPVVAPAWRRMAAIAVDVLIAAALLAAAVWFPLDHWPRIPHAVVVGALAVALLLGWWAWRSRTGRGLGHLLFGLRTVDAVTLLPGHPWRAPRAALDLRAGADPLAPTARPVRLATATATNTTMQLDRGLVLEFDDGSRHPVRSTVVVGRDPSDHPAPVAKLSVPDLSRSMARAHLALTPEGALVRITHLGGVAETWVLRPDGTREQLAANASRRLAVGTELQLGKRRMRVLPRELGTETSALRAVGTETAQTSALRAVGTETAQSSALRAVGTRSEQPDGPAIPTRNRGTA